MTTNFLCVRKWNVSQLISLLKIICRLHCNCKYFRKHIKYTIHFSVVPQYFPSSHINIILILWCRIWLQNCLIAVAGHTIYIYFQCPPFTWRFCPMNTEKFNFFVFLENGKMTFTVCIHHIISCFSIILWGHYIFFFSLFDVTNIIYVIRQKEDVYLQYVSFSRQASVEANVLLKTLGSSFCLCAWGSVSSHFFYLSLRNHRPFS